MKESGKTSRFLSTFIDSFHRLESLYHAAGELHGPQGIDTRQNPVKKSEKVLDFP